MKATESLKKKVKNQIFDEFAANPASLAYGLLAAAGRLTKKRASWVKYKKRQLAREKHKKTPRK